MPARDPEGAGSIIVLIATDAPLLRSSARLAQAFQPRFADAVGKFIGGEHSSGDFGFCFATGNRALESDEGEIPLRMLNDSRINSLYEAVIDAVEESILNAMLGAETMTGRDGNTVYALPPNCSSPRSRPAPSPPRRRSTRSSFHPARTT